jgi:hypothetical protein
MNPASWAVEEMRSVVLGDPRRRRRAALLLTALADRPAASIPVACGDWGAAKAAYRFWDNARITPEKLLAAHRDATLGRCAAHPVVLAVQDTTMLDFTSHPALTAIGPLGHGDHQGMHVHSVLAVSPDGEPLGVLDQQVWARDADTTGLRHQRRARPTAAKESQRWLDGLTATQRVVPERIRVVTEADREADIYDLFAVPRPPHSDLLIRAAHDRKVQQQPVAYLWPTVRAAPELTRIAITVPRQAKRPARPAVLTVRVAAVQVHPPRSRQHDHTLTPLPVTALLAEEEPPPPDQPALCWLLLTTVPLPDGEAAKECLGWYRQRWTIERFHFVLKSGSHIERLQLQSFARMDRALATLSIVAWRVLWLREHARATPTVPCTTVLTPLQWAALYATIHHTTAPPPGPAPLNQAIRWIAQLGGFLARASDGDPGVTTLWRGWRRLETITETWALARQLPPDTSCG